MSTGTSYWLRTLATTRLLKLIHLIAPVPKPWAVRLVEHLHAWAEHELAIMQMTKKGEDHDQM